MRHLIAILGLSAALVTGIGLPLAAQETSPETDVENTAAWLAPLEADALSLDAFTWIKRPIVVFSDTPADPRFTEQLELLRAEAEALLDRDVVVITDADPAARSAIRTQLRPRGFQLVLIGKDGGVKLRKPFPWSVRELSRVIDKMPLRQHELRPSSSTE